MNSGLCRRLARADCSVIAHASRCRAAMRRPPSRHHLATPCSRDVACGDDAHARFLRDDTREIARAFIFSMRLCLTVWLRDRIASPCTHRLTRFAHHPVASTLPRRSDVKRCSADQRRGNGKGRFMNRSLVGQGMMTSMMTMRHMPRSAPPPGADRVPDACGREAGASATRHSAGHVARYPGNCAGRTVAGLAGRDTGSAHARSGRTPLSIWMRRMRCPPRHRAAIGTPSTGRDRRSSAP